MSQHSKLSEMTPSSSTSTTISVVPGKPAEARDEKLQLKVLFNGSSSLLTRLGHSCDRLRHVRGFPDAGIVLGAHTEHVGLCFLQILNLQFKTKVHVSEPAHPTAAASCATKKPGRESAMKNLHEDLLHGLVVDSPPGLVRSLGLLHVHVEAVDGVATLIYGSLPQQHQ